MSSQNIDRHTKPVLPTEQPPVLNFTLAAARRVAGLLQEEDNPDLMLRVFITGGGCSGFQYGFTFDEASRVDDALVERVLTHDEDGEGIDGPQTVRLLIDPLSLQYLRGADIDYREDENGAQFVIRNPNAKTTCGCGSSFSV